MKTKNLIGRSLSITYKQGVENWGTIKRVSPFKHDKEFYLVVTEEYPHFLLIEVSHLEQIIEKGRCDVRKTYEDGVCEFSYILK